MIHATIHPLSSLRLALRSYHPLSFKPHLQTALKNVTTLQKPKHQGDLIYFLYTQVTLSHLCLISLEARPLLLCIHNSWEDRGCRLAQSQRAELMAPSWRLPRNQEADILTPISPPMAAFCQGKGLQACVTVGTESHICKTQTVNKPPAPVTFNASVTELGTTET